MLLCAPKTTVRTPSRSGSLCDLHTSVRLRTLPKSEAYAPRVHSCCPYTYIPLATLVTSTYLSHGGVESDSQLLKYSRRKALIAECAGCGKIQEQLFGPPRVNIALGSEIARRTSSRGIACLFLMGLHPSTPTAAPRYARSNPVCATNPPRAITIQALP